LAVDDVPELYWKSPPVTNENTEVWRSLVADAFFNRSEINAMMLCLPPATKRENRFSFSDAFFPFAEPLIMFVFLVCLVRPIIAPPPLSLSLAPQLLLPNLFIDDVDIIEDFTGRIAVNVSIRYGLLRMYAITGCMLLRCVIRSLKQR
jgi:hypothetical protein